MENNNNFNQPPQQPQQQSFQQPSPPEKPIGLPPEPEGNGGGFTKLAGWLSLIALIAVLLYFTGAWSWLGGLVGREAAAPETAEKTEQLETEEVENVRQNNDGETAENDLDAAAKVGKGRVSVVISSFLPGGVTLSTGVADPNIEIRKVYLRNPVKDSWLLVYDGFRPLDLNLLNATGEKHELIAISLAALAYDQIRIEFADLVKIDQRDGQKVARQRTADLDLAMPADWEGGQTIINVGFNISKPDRPQPTVAIER